MESTYITPLSYSESVVSWIRSSLENKPAIAATLTFNVPKGKVIPSEYADHTIKEYAKRLNRCAFGQSSKPKRGGQVLNFVPVREGGGRTGIPLHYHAVIGVPDGKDLTEWADQCADAWVKLKYSSKRFNTFYEVQNDGWYQYMAKQRTKADPLDYLVVDAVQLNGQPALPH